MKPKRFYIYFIVLLAALFCPGSAACGEARKPTEYEVKAAYIYNFAKFIEWPLRFRDRGDIIHVCVIGDDPIDGSLADIDGKSVLDRKIRVRLDVALQNLDVCEIVFISHSAREQLDQILKAVNGFSVLTIGDTRGFAQRGVLINFFMENNRVLFEINPKAAVRAGLKINSNLLRIARIVGRP